eukprot:3576869-Pleurochrysis_carterae.AAC.1
MVAVAAPACCAQAEESIWHLKSSMIIHCYGQECISYTYFVTYHGDTDGRTEKMTESSNPAAGPPFRFEGKCVALN